jgi:hypothetical protein
MPGIQITVSPALIGSSHLVRVVSVETVPYSRTPSGDQLFTLNGHRLPHVGNLCVVAGVIFAVSVDFE